MIGDLLETAAAIASLVVSAKTIKKANDCRKEINEIKTIGKRLDQSASKAEKGGRS